MSTTFLSTRHPRHHLPRVLAFLFCVGLSIQVVVAATPPPPGVAPSDPPIGGFGIDGDLQANTPTANVGDWLPGAGGTGGSVLDASGAPLDPIATLHTLDPYNDSSSDMIFAGGEKWFDDPNTWNWTYGKSSSKTDINNVLFHIAPDAEGHIWGAVAADRFSTSGDSYIDFEFLQNKLVRNPDNTFTSAGPDGGRTVNDLLLSLAFTGGGKVADFFVWSWQPDGQGGHVYVDMTGSIPTGKVLAALNGSSIAVPYGAFGSTTYARYAFAEGAVDLTALLTIFDPCMSLVVETIMVKTKASQSSNASIEDLIDPIHVKLTIGPSAQAGDDQIACHEGDATSFTLAGMASQGIFPVASTVWSILEGEATIEDPSSLTTAVHVSSDSAVLRLTVFQQNGCESTDDIRLSVQALPACDIAGPTSDICPGAMQMFNAPEGMDSYAWSLTGNGSIVGPIDGPTVMVKSGSACAEPFSLTLNSQLGDCLNTCQLDVMVQDTTAPELVRPAEVTIECHLSNDPADTGLATASDLCDAAPVITFSDDMRPGDCAAEGVIHRTWTATDACGNETSSVQLIHVVDTTAPSIEVPSGITLECPANTSPKATGWATGSDNCGDARVSYRDDVDILCGASRIITRTWKVQDGCGNEATGIQVIRVEDNTPPVMSCVVATTYSQGGYGGNGTPAEILIANYFTVFPNGITIGLYDPSNGHQAPNGLHWEATGHGLASLREFISQGGGTSRALEADAVDADDGEKRGELAAQTLTLTINMRFNERGVIGAGPNNFADLVYSRDGDTLSGMTVRQILETANHALAGLGLPEGQSYSSLNKLADLLNHAFHQGNHSAWAQAYLEVPAILLQCASEIPAPDPSRVMASDACGGKVTIFHEGDVISDQSCPGRYIITRTWVAMDECGNMGTCSQRIIVDDTTAPLLSGEQERVVSPDAPWDFLAPEATDNCDDIIDLVIVNTVTNVLGDNAMVATRTWQASDPCGNAAEFTQVVTVGQVMAVQSSFDTGSDHWMLMSYSQDQNPTHMESGGQGGGYITSQTGGSDTIWFWTAPEAYLGDRSDYYGGVLTFAMTTSDGSNSALPPSVLMVRGNLTLALSLEDMPGTEWTPFSVGLSESDDWINTSTGQSATQQEIIHVLSNVEWLLIQVDLGVPGSTCGLDNVVMAPPARLDVMSWTLRVESTGSGSIRLVWPAMDTTCHVEESDSLDTPNWRVLEVTREERDGYFRLEFQPENSPKFYRLKKP